MNLKRIILVCILLFATVLCGCGADSSRDDALLLYQEILKEAPAIEGEREELADASFDYDQNLELFGNHCELFALHDIDQDGIPELITLSTINFRWNSMSIYTYQDGEAILLKSPLDKEAHGTFEQRSTANGAYITYICKDDHIHSVWRGTNAVGEAEEENHAYALSKAALTAVDCDAKENENVIYFSDIAKANTEANIDEII